MNKQELKEEKEYWFNESVELYDNVKNSFECENYDSAMSYISEFIDLMDDYCEEYSTKYSEHFRKALKHLETHYTKSKTHEIMEYITKGKHNFL